LFAEHLDLRRGADSIGRVLRRLSIAVVPLAAYAFMFGDETLRDEVDQGP
jgi:hypothetical protein